MTFLEFKDFLKDNKTGNINLPSENRSYKSSLQASLEYVANQIEPIDLITDDVTKETLRWLDATQIVRRPIATTEDTDKIDIDEQLTYAVAFHFLMMKTTDITEKSIFKDSRDNAISTYTWNNYKLLQNMGVVR